jgi:serine/threonine-protein kinase
VKELFGPYLLLDRIATGGMGEIFLAKLTRGEGFEKLVVIKRMLPHLSRNRTFIEMFQAEARIAAQLSHQNIVQIHDFGREGDSYYIAMEYVHGVDLRALLFHAAERGRLPSPAMALYVAGACSAGLDYAHRRCDLSGVPLGIIHRDVSPQNILLSFEGEVKLTDFGLAKAKLAAVESEAGTLKGKYAYLSPEQARGHKVGQRSDLFSLGVVLYEMLFGERLFGEGDSVAAALERVACCEIPDLRARRPSPPEPVVGVLERALARDPDLRFPSAAEMHAAIEGAREAIGEPASALGLASYVRDVVPWLAEPRGAAAYEETVISVRPIASREPPVRRGRTRLAVLALTAAAVVAGVVVASLEWPPPSAPSPSAVRLEVRSEPSSARVEVRSKPDGADLFLDGVRVAGRTPHVLEAVALGTHRLRVEKTGFRAWEREVRVDAQGPGVISVELAAAARLRVVTSPPGARVLVDGVPLQRPSPAEAHDLVPGSEVRVDVRRPGYRPVVRRVRIAGAGQELRLALQPAGVALALDVHPAARRVLLDRRAVGKTPMRTRALPYGDHFLQLLDDEGRRWVKIRLGISRASQRPGAENVLLTMNASPWAKVYLGARNLGQVPLANRPIGFGRHRLELRRADGSREVVRLSVEPEGER